MRLYMTGSSSFIGRELATQCQANGIAVSGSDLAESGNATFTSGDIRDPNFADLIDEGTDTLVHLAAISRESDCKGCMDDWLQTNVLASQNVLRAAAARGVTHFIFASSEWVYDFSGEAERRETDTINPVGVTSEYGLSKLMAESLLRRTADDLGVILTILRFGIVYGPRTQNWSAVEALLHAVATRDQVTVGSLDTARRFLHVRDVADAIVAAAKRARDGIFNVQGPALAPLREIIGTAKKITARDPMIIESDARNPSVRPISNRAAFDALGWSAGIGIEEGMRDISACVLGRANE